MTEVQKWISKHYTIEKPDLIKCNHCETVFSSCDQTQNLQHHLYDKHEITELYEHPERDNILQSYKILKVAICNECETVFNLALNSVFTLITHLKINHPAKCNLTYISRRSLSNMDNVQTDDNASSALTSPRSIRDDDFHGNESRIQNEVQTNTLEQPLKQKKEETEENAYKSCSSSESDFYGFSDSKVKTYNLRRRTDVDK